MTLSTHKSSKWPIVRFDQMAECLTVRVEPSETTLDRYVGLEHLDPETLKINRWGTPADIIGEKLHFWPGDLIFGKRRAYQRKLAVADFEGICSAHAMVLRAKREIALPEFLPFFMQSDLFYERALSISVGSLSPTINWNTLARQEFPLPPIDEQRRIAEILWAADETFLKYRTVLVGIDRVIDVFRDDVFGDNAIRQYQLHELCDNEGIQIGPFGSQLHEADYLPEGIPVVMPINMINGEIDIANIARISLQKANELKRHKLKSGDILLPRRGDLSKRAYVLPHQEGWICGTGSVRIRVRNGAHSRAAFHSLNTKRVNNWLSGNAVGTTMPNLNTSIVSSIPIGLPLETKVEQNIYTLDSYFSAQTLINEHLRMLTNLKANFLNDLI